MLLEVYHIILTKIEKTCIFEDGEALQLETLRDINVIICFGIEHYQLQKYNNYTKHNIYNSFLYLYYYIWQQSISSIANRLCDWFFIYEPSKLATGDESVVWFNDQHHCARCIRESAAWRYIWWKRCCP